MNGTRYHQAYGHRQPPPYYQNLHGQPSHTPNYPPAHLTPYELYAKPPQPMDLLNGHNSPNPMAGSPEEPSSGIFGNFTDENGQLNFDKMMGSISQIAGTYHQVTPIIKEIGSLINSFR
jgi:hypothetical protein